MPFTSQPLRILLIAKNDARVHLLRGVLAASTIPPIQVEHASNGWDAQRHAADGGYDGVVLEDSLSDIDGETLLGRLKAIGVCAPALLLTSTFGEQEATGCDDYLSETDALKGIRSSGLSSRWSSVMVWPKNWPWLAFRLRRLPLS